MLILWTLLSCTPCDAPATGGKALVLEGDQARFVDAAPEARRLAVDGDGVLWTQSAGAIFKDGVQSTALVGASQGLKVVDGRAVFLEIDEDRQVLVHDPADAGGAPIAEAGDSYDAALWGDADGLHVLRVGDPGGLFLHSYNNGWELPFELVPGLPQRNWLVAGPGPSWARAEGVDFVVESWDGEAVVEEGTLSGVDFVWALEQDAQGDLFARVGTVEVSEAYVASLSAGCSVEIPDLVAPFALVPQDLGVLAFGVTSTGEPSTWAVSADCSLGERNAVGTAIDASLHLSAVASDGARPAVLLQYVLGSGSEGFAYEGDPLCP